MKVGSKPLSARGTRECWQSGNPLPPSIFSEYRLTISRPDRHRRSTPIVILAASRRDRHRHPTPTIISAISKPGRHRRSTLQLLTRLVNTAVTFNYHYGAMAADYYPILARAVSRLAINNAQARQELYERARTVLVTELGRQEMPALGTVGERIVLETAILKVEAESQSQGEAKPEAFADYVPSHDAQDKIEGPF